MKKVLALFMVFVLACSLLSGCDMVRNLLKGFGSSGKKSAGDYESLTDAAAGLPGDEALAYIFNILDGYWISDNKFVGFVGASQNVEYGLLGSSYGARGEVTSAVGEEATKILLSVYFPEVPADMMGEGNDEYTLTISIDVINFDTDHTLEIQVPALEDGGWHTYTYLGNSLSEGTPTVYSDVESAIAGLPDKGAMRYIWDQLNGYWISNNQFIGFFIEDGKFLFEYGLLQSSYWLGGEVVSIESTMEYTMSLTVFIPGVDASFIDGPREDKNQTVIINLQNLEDGNNNISAVIDNLGGGGWAIYAYHGMTLEGAEVYSGSIDMTSVTSVWSSLYGYWADTEPLTAYFGFLYNDFGVPILHFGVFDFYPDDKAIVIDGKTLNDDILELTIYVPAVETNQSAQIFGHDAFVDTVKIDFSEYGSNNVIKISSHSQIIGGWYTYTYRGETFDQAHQSYSP